MSVVLDRFQAVAISRESVLYNDSTSGAGFNNLIDIEGTKCKQNLKNYNIFRLLHTALFLGGRTWKNITTKNVGRNSHTNSTIPNDR